MVFSFVESFTEIRPQTEEGIRSYLSSGMIRGIGPKMAEQIVGRFGIRTFEILDYYPDSLLEIKGITPKKLEVNPDILSGRAYAP
ncbi:MAG: helix-hairpin-helix domain-containing protein [Suilimivivens sp.]